MSRSQATARTSGGEYASRNPMTALGSARQRTKICLDPRTKLICLIIINMLVLGRGPLWFILVCGAVVFFFVLDISRGLGLAVYTALVGLSSLLFIALHHTPASWFTDLVMGVGFWVTRFTISIAFAGWVIATTGASELSTALSSLRLPRVLTVPFDVVLRFIPLVLIELHQVIDAMRLRGVLRGPSSLFLHPITTAEFILVPLLSSMTRMADELSASALIRGLGRKGKRTSIVALKFSWTDVVMALLIAGLLLLRFSRWEMTW